MSSDSAHPVHPAAPGQSPEDSTGAPPWAPGAFGRLEIHLPARPMRSYPLLVGRGVWARLPECLPSGLHGLVVVSDEDPQGLPRQRT